MSHLRSGSRLAAVLLLLLASAAAAAMATAASDPPSCQNDIDTLWTTCRDYVQKEGPKVPPSPGCCRTVKAVDAHYHARCICNYLASPEAREKINVDKVFYVTVPEGCGGSKQV